MKNLIISYILCGLGLITPLSGLHRFYLGKPISGIFYLFTWGFFGLGTIIDLIRMPYLVDEYNLRQMMSEGFFTQQFCSFGRLSSPERSILKCASTNHGVITIPQVTLSTGLSLNEAKRELDRLFKSGFCQKDIDEDGNEIYIFKGLKAKEPLF